MPWIFGHVNQTVKSPAKEFGHFEGLKICFNALKLFSPFLKTGVYSGKNDDREMYFLKGEEINHPPLVYHCLGKTYIFGKFALTFLDNVDGFFGFS